MNKTIIFGVISKSSSFGRRQFIHAGSVRIASTRIHDIVTVRRSMRVRNVRQEPPVVILQHLNYICTTDVARRNENGNESDSDPEAGSDEMLTDSDAEENDSQVHRRFLYPHSQDPVILKLFDCASVEAVFDVVAHHENGLNAEHASQAVLTLWDLRGMFLKNRVETCSGSEKIFADGFNDSVGEYTKEITSHNVFKKIVGCLECRFSELAPDASCCTFLYFSRMGIPFSSPVMQKLLFHIEMLIEKSGHTFPLSALSRFSVTLRGSNRLSFCYAIKRSLPILFSKIDNCQSEQDVRLLVICLKNISYLVDLSNFHAFKCKVEGLIKDGVFSTFHSSVIAKTALFFSNNSWNIECADINRKLLLLLREKMSQLSASDIIRVNKVIQNNMESADLQAKLSERASHLLWDEEKREVLDKSKSLKLLACIASFSSPKERKTLEEHASNYLKEESNLQYIDSLFQIIRYLKTSDLDLCNKYWSKTLEVMNIYATSSTHYIRQYSNRYMHFNNNLGGTFRHSDFENQIMEWYLYHYETSIIGYIPSQLVDMISFFVAYSDKKENEFYNKLDGLIVRLCEMSSQLSMVDCTKLSRGLQIARQFQYNLHEKTQLFNILVKLNSLLNTLSEKHIQNADYRLGTLNTMMRSYVMRKAPQTTDIFQHLITRYDNFCGPLHSKLLRNTVHNLVASKCLIPKVVDRLVEFVIQNEQHLFGETAEMILFLCFYLGYTPPNIDTFLKACSEVIIRESERMSGLSVLQSSLSLCFFHHLPEKLVHLIFTIDFLEKLDGEIANCYAKAFYPTHVRKYLMQLNRAVCLDYPEYDVPWFHKKYCEEIIATEPVQSSAFHSEVKQALIDTLGEKNYMQIDTHSPYGYRIDFEIFVNERNVPVFWKRRTDKNISKKAVILVKEESFSKNVKSLDGFMQMKKRHLEILGYEVIEIEQTVWNSMYMSEPGMKYQFLQEKVLKHYDESIREMMY